MSSDFRQGMIVGALLVGLLLAGVVGFCNAQVSLSVYGLSKHSESGYCEINPGGSINYAFSKDLRVGHGRFLNSQCQWSNATGAVYTPLHFGNWSFGVAVLRLTGYKERSIWAPLPVGSYALDKRHAIDFFGVHKGEEAVVGAAWRINF